MYRSGLEVRGSNQAVRVRFLTLPFGHMYVAGVLGLRPHAKLAFAALLRLRRAGQSRRLGDGHVHIGSGRPLSRAEEGSLQGERSRVRVPIPKVVIDRSPSHAERICDAFTAARTGPSSSSMYGEARYTPTSSFTCGFARSAPSTSSRPHKTIHSKHSSEESRLVRNASEHIAGVPRARTHSPMDDRE